MGLIVGFSAQWRLWMEWLASTIPTFGLSTLSETLFTNSYLQESAKLLILGSIIEAGRRLCQWLIERFKFQYFLSARFDEGDPAYEWLVLFLTEENVWKKSRDFTVTARSSKRKWAVTSGPGAAIDGNVDYVPSFDAPQLFRWQGHWVEITKLKSNQVVTHKNHDSFASLRLIIYTREMTVLSALVEEARQRYNKTSKQHLTIYCVDSPNYGLGPLWNNVKVKLRRPLNSLILAGGIADSLIDDANEFFNMGEWYAHAGIPHRRGYLLYGPPGTGKTSTVHAVAGELGLEIYTISLASNFIDDSFLQRAVSSVPKRSLLLIEDIDCAFPPRGDADDFEEHAPLYPGIDTRRFGMPSHSKVTLSGLLNMIDGVNSEDGKLFFATTNHIDHLDPALLRPGRIDKKVQYKMATKEQILALYMRFFPGTQFAHSVECTQTAELFNDNKRPFDNNSHSCLSALANLFAEFVPENEFSTAELQGYLLMYKTKPLEAVSGIAEWVEQERMEKRTREEREARQKQKVRESRLKAKTAMVTDLVKPLQQQQTTAIRDTAAKPSISSIPPSNTKHDSVISPQIMAHSTTAPTTAQPANNPDFQHVNGVRIDT